MDKEYFQEISALVSSFLTAKLKEKPDGFTLPEFARLFPKDTDEPEDWYIRVGKRTPLEVLELIGDPIVLRQYNNGVTVISLNKRSEKVDHDMVDLVTHQKASSKKRSTARPHYLRAKDSFAMNRQFSGFSSYGGNDRLKNRLAYNDSNRYDNSSDRRRSPSAYSSQQPYVPSRYSSGASWGDSSARVASNDPRSRSSMMVPPQVRPTPPSQSSLSGPSPAKQQAPSSLSSTRTPSTPTSRSASQPSTSPTSQKTAASSTGVREPEDPNLNDRRSRLRQRLLHLLVRKYPELKLLFLPGIYQMEFEEKLDPDAFGHKSLTKLLSDPYFSEYIQINYHMAPMITVSARVVSNGKENVSSKDGNRLSGLVEAPNSSSTNGTSEPLSDKSNRVSSIRSKLKAIGPFNLDIMLQNLEPLGEISAPTLGKNPVEEIVKYRTLRIILKSQDPKHTLNLSDWEMRYQQEWNCRGRVHIRDYGFRTLLEFFKYLAQELPIKVRLHNDEWIAVTDPDSVSEWLSKKLDDGRYRAITCIDAKYEQIAFPNEAYTYSGLKDLPEGDWLKVNIMSVMKSPPRMWLQIRTNKRIEDHLSIEASLTCYDDYKRKGFFSVPNTFIKPGFPCVAYDETQQRWCRSVIIKVSANVKDEENPTVTAFLVDYAINKTFTKSQLLCILKSHLKHSVGLIYTKLQGVSDEQAHARQVLQEYTSPPVTLACKVNATEEVANQDHHLPKQFYTVTLIDTSQGKDRNLAEAINNYSLANDE